MWRSQALSDKDDPEIQDAIAKGVAEGIRLAKEQEADQEGRAKRKSRVTALKIAAAMFVAPPVLVFAFAFVLAVTGYQRPQWVVPDVVNIRSGPGTDHDAIEQLAGETSVRVVAEDGDWTHIEYEAGEEKRDGWVRSDLIGSKSAARSRTEQSDMAAKKAEWEAFCAQIDYGDIAPLVYKYEPLDQAVLVHDLMWSQLRVDTKETTRKYFLRCRNIWKIKSARDGRTLAKTGLWSSGVRE